MRESHLLFEGCVSLVDPGPVPMMSSSKSTDGGILAVGSAYSPKMVVVGTGAVTAHSGQVRHRRTRF